jgi:hypothetical protein
MRTAVFVALTGFGVLLGYCSWSLIAEQDVSWLNMVTAGAGALSAIVLLVSAPILQRTANGFVTAARPAMSALLGRSLDPPPWVDAEDHSFLVFVDPGTLATTGFDPSEDLVNRVVTQARLDCTRQFDDIFSGANTRFADRVAEYADAMEPETPSQMLSVFPEHQVPT